MYGSLIVKTRENYPQISFRVRFAELGIINISGELVACLDKKIHRPGFKLDFKQKLVAFNFAMSLLYRRFITNNLGSVISSIA